jgi:4-oxalocrotonate tautomerase
MPVITLEVGKISNEQKSQLVKEFTATIVKVTKAAQQGVYVFIKENEKENIGIGGQLLSDK